ncbi:TrmH family RNA methyltransferase [Methylomagnum sp.]
MYKPRPPRSGHDQPPAENYRPIRRPPPDEFSEEFTPSTSPERVLRIAGLPAVAALFKRSPERVLRFFYEDRMVPQVGDFCGKMAKLRRPYRMVDANELTKIAGTVRHGGVVAVAEPRPVLTFDPAEARAWAEARQPLVVVDGIGNPHNLGAIARTLAFFGFRRLVVSDHPGQASLSDSAYRVAEGGLDILDVYRATGLPGVLKRLKPHYRVVGTALTRHGLPLDALHDNDPRPVLLVLGNEETGLPPATLEVCDAVVTIRGSGELQSLNVSAATAILAYALRPRPQTPPPARRPTEFRGKPRPKPDARGGKPRPPR